MKDFKAILADAKQADVSIKRFDRSLENLRDTLNKWESMSTTKPLNSVKDLDQPAVKWTVGNINQGD